MPKDANTLAATGALLGDPARAAMLTALLDGRALTATELARAARITPQTASGHLAKLTSRGLVAVVAQGRHRYHRLASPAVAVLLETVMALELRPALIAAPVAVGPRDRDLRRVRTCYDHLAGELAVALADRLIGRGHLELGVEGAAVTAAGAAFLGGIGVALPAVTRDRARFCRPCLDWTERRPHVGGTVGAALLDACLAHRWLRRREGTRALALMPAGELAFRTHFGIVARRAGGPIELDSRR